MKRLGSPNSTIQGEAGANTITPKNNPSVGEDTRSVATGESCLPSPGVSTSSIYTSGDNTGSSTSEWRGCIKFKKVGLLRASEAIIKTVKIGLTTLSSRFTTTFRTKRSGDLRVFCSLYFAMMIESAWRTKIKVLRHSGSCGKSKRGPIV